MCFEVDGWKVLWFLLGVRCGFRLVWYWLGNWELRVEKCILRVIEWVIDLILFVFYEKISVFRGFKSSIAKGSIRCLNRIQLILLPLFRALMGS